MNGTKGKLPGLATRPQRHTRSQRNNGTLAQRDFVMTLREGSHVSWASALKRGAKQQHDSLMLCGRPSVHSAPRRRRRGSSLDAVNRTAPSSPPTHRAYLPTAEGKKKKLDCGWRDGSFPHASVHPCFLLREHPRIGLPTNPNHAHTSQRNCLLRFPGLLNYSQHHLPRLACCTCHSRLRLFL